MGSQLHRNSVNFKVALGILLDIYNNGKPDSDLDKELLRLWVYTLIGMGYIRKEAQDYVITEKGKEELRRHPEMLDGHKHYLIKNC